MTVAAVTFAGALALLLAYSEVRVLQADGYKLLYDGRWIVHHGIPHTNTLSAVGYGERWVNAQWLAEVAYYGVWTLGGFALVAIVSALSIAVAYMIFAALLRRIGVSVGGTILFTAVALLGLRHWAFIRAQDLALPLFALLLVICLTDSEVRQPTKRLVLLSPLLILWANIHGSVMLGTALAVAYLLWRAATTFRAGSRRAAAAVTALAAIVVVSPLATPYGWDVIHYYRQFVGNGAQHIVGAEGRSPVLLSGSGFLVYGGIVFVLAYGAWALVRHRRAPWLLLGACVLTGIAATARIGNLVWHTMVMALLLAELTKGSFAAARGRKATVVALTVLSLALGATLLVSLALRPASRYESETAMQATSAAAAAAVRHPCWLILADNLDAAALEWHRPQLAPRIAYDARVELYSKPAMMRWAIFQTVDLPGWRATTNGYQVLVAATQFRPRLVTRLAAMPATVVLAHDDRGIAVINTQAVRTEPATCGVVRSS